MRESRRLTALFGMRLTDTMRQQIAAKAPELVVLDGFAGWRSELVRRRRSLNAAEQLALDEFDQHMLQADIYVNRNVPERMLERMPRLKWIHFTSAGIDHVTGTPLDGAPLLITYARGLNGVWVAEGAMSLLFMLAGGARQLAAQQLTHTWKTVPRVSLRGKTLAVRGIGMRRSVAVRTAGDDGVLDTLFPPAGLRDMLAEADVLLLSAPLTPETQGMIGAGELAVMKPSALLVNVARGQLVDEQALTEALRDGRLGGAALDVFNTEPLPSEHPLWDLPNVLVSPHNAGNSDQGEAEHVMFFLENLRRYLDGGPLVNVVDWERGY
ncbi:MAG: D-2-hydroxyacid dehydrogenase [Chloroflexi bacterium]|nr:D-2-hydroxyacid dehydrogenase [Chloroflexota bacterium]